MRSSGGAMRPQEAGFTLLETGLAIVVGMVLVVGGTYAYRALKEQAGDAAMRQKVQDLQVLVEEFYSSSYALPNVVHLRDAWERRRSDHSVSPWGGPVVQPGSYFKGISSTILDHGGNIPAGTFTDFQGGLYYYPINPQPNGKEGRATLWDHARGQSAPVTFYGVAGNKVTRAGGLQHYYVLSGR